MKEFENNHLPEEGNFINEQQAEENSQVYEAENLTEETSAYAKADDAAQEYDEFTFNTQPLNTHIQADSAKAKTKISRFKVVVASALTLAVFLGTVVAFSMPKLSEEDKAANVAQTQTQQNQYTQTTVNNANIQTGQELTTQEIAALVGPAVVGIENYTTGNYYYYQTEVNQGSGSGVIISQDGYIVTNYHVIEGSTKLKVTLSTGGEYDATVVGADENSDLALIKIEESNLPYATLGDSSQVMVGDRAVAIGNPLGNELMGTVTQGIISAVNRNVTVDNRTMTLLQTDAAINSGNSGGALINAYGQVIGINSVKMAASGVEGLGFAIPSNTVNQVISDLREYGYVRGRITIGIGGQNITSKMAQYYDMPMGFYIQEVYSGSGAEQAGLKPGDIIVKCDGQVVQDIDDINAVKQNHSVGETMEIQVVRNGQNMTFNVVLQEEKPETAW